MHNIRYRSSPTYEHSTYKHFQPQLQATTKAIQEHSKWFHSETDNVQRETDNMDSVLNETGVYENGHYCSYRPLDLNVFINRGASLPVNNLVSEASFSNISHKTQTQQYKQVDFGYIDAAHLSGTM